MSNEGDVVTEADIMRLLTVVIPSQPWPPPVVLPPSAASREHALRLDALDPLGGQ